MPPKILLVEDEAVTYYETKKMLENWGYNLVGTATSGEMAIQMIGEYHPDLILMDIHLKGEMDGIDVAKKTLTWSNIPIIYISAHTEDKILQKAKKTEPYGFLIKPYGKNELKFAIEIALHRHQINKKLTREDIDPILFEKSLNIVILLDNNFKVLYVNDFTLKLFKTKLEDIIGEKLSSFFKTHDIFNDLNKKLIKIQEIKILRADQEIYLDYRIIPIKSETDKCYMFIANDVTESLKQVI
jgi:CheY-like chemotaxis protein